MVGVGQLIDLADAGAGQDVVELVQQQQLPRSMSGFSHPNLTLLHALQLLYFLFQVLLRFRTIFS